jgi:hypothetical protein
MTTAYAPTRAAGCRECPALTHRPAHREHHDRLLTVDVDIDELLALLELAVTWHELDYSESAVMGPAEWLTFAQTHDWTDPERAERAFSMALDIVGRAAVGARSEPALATVIELVRG